MRRPEADAGDTRPDVRVALRAARAWGVLSLEELRECGLSRDSVRVRVRRGWLHPLHRQVYAVGHPNPPLEGRFLAAAKACGSCAVVSHFAAAALFKLVPWDGRHPEVTVPGTAPRAHRGVHVHRTRWLDPPDVTSYRGIPITSPARTLADLASSLNDRALRRAVRQALSMRRVELRDLTEVLARLGPRRGVRKLSAIVAAGPALTRSELEDTVLELIVAGGLVPPDVNVPLVIGGRRVIPDFRWPAERLVVEADGAAWHDDKLAREDDAERQALLEARGERVVRVTWDQAVSRPRQTLARLVAAGAPKPHRVSDPSA